MVRSEPRRIVLDLEYDSRQQHADDQRTLRDQYREQPDRVGRTRRLDEPDQWSDLILDGSYSTSNTTRDNNTQMISGLYGTNTVNNRTVLGVLVDSTNPTNG